MYVYDLKMKWTNVGTTELKKKGTKIKGERAVSGNAYSL